MINKNKIVHDTIVTEIKKKELVEKLLNFGFTREESELYIYLHKVKSATIGEIHKSSDFKDKKRPNLYKTINSLIRKKMVKEEVKDNIKKFFPEPSDIILHFFIKDKEKELEELKNLSKEITNNLDRIYKKPNEDFFWIPNNIKEIFFDVINRNWIISENPESFEKRGMGKIYSYEFNTLRKFGADSAGLVINEFRYKEHRDQSINSIRSLMKEELKRALENLKEQGHIYVKKYWFNEVQITIPNVDFPIKIIEIHGKLNIPSVKMKGGMTSLNFKEFDTKIISFWGADFRDFMEILVNISKKFSILNMEEINIERSNSE